MKSGRGYPSPLLLLRWAPGPNTEKGTAMLQSLCDLLNAALRDARTRFPEQFQRAVDAYVDSVVPREDLFGIGLVTFADWFLFDHRPEGGQTPLWIYAAGLPAGAACDDASSVAGTALFASFTYDACAADGAIAALTDIATGVSYEVEGSQLTDCPGWVGSVVTGRIARTADGAWHAVSQLFYRDRAPLEVGVRVARDIRASAPEAAPLSLAFAAERIREAGAREVHWVPVFAKKERPAWQLQVVVATPELGAVERAIFTHTTTIGIRRWTCARTVLAREDIEVASPWGPVRAKRATLPDGTSRVKPEFADCARIARTEGVALREVVERVVAAASTV